MKGVTVKGGLCEADLCEKGVSAEGDKRHRPPGGN